jgi:Flp pilus assembly protein TadG
MPTRNRRNGKHKATWGGMKNERGMTLVFVALGFMGFFAATMLAIDVGMLMTARNQAQNSADAGALAGAVGLGFNDYDDRSETGPAVTSALSAARTNQVMDGVVSVNPPDVVFENDPTGEPNRVKVTVYRNAEHGNAISTIIAGIFGIATVDISATATAEVAKADAMNCVKPFTIPDKWTEKTDPNAACPGDWAECTFDGFDKKGKPIPGGDVYIPADQPGYTGYDAVKDRGLKLMIRAGTGNEITPSFYFSITLDGDTGADEYRDNIMGCNQTMFKWGQLMIQEPGNMMGPTTQGARDLIAQDPAADWDLGCNCIKGGMGEATPRKFPIPLYDPVYYDSGKREGRFADLKVANWIGFFLDEVVGNNIYGRITPISGYSSGEGPAPDGVFPIVIRLIK